jgi:hypothetical protein
MVELGEAPDVLNFTKDRINQKALVCSHVLNESCVMLRHGWHWSRPKKSSKSCSFVGERQLVQRSTLEGTHPPIMRLDPFSLC